MRKGIFALASAVAAVTLMAAPHATLAQTPNIPRLTIFIGYSATSGIGYDTYGRVLARVIGKHLPGNPVVTASNRPGAGSMTLANYIANVAPKDGTEIGLIGRGVPMDTLIFGNVSAAKFDANQQQWIGSMNNEVGGFFISSAAPVQTLNEVMAGKPLTVGSAGAASDLHAFALVMNSILGAKLKIIDGYPGTNEILLALERGEVDGLIGYSWGAAKMGSAAMLQSGKLINILQLGLKKHPELPNLPLIMDLVKSEEEKRVLELIFARQTMGRPLVAPAGTPPVIVTALRDGFAKAMQDPELVQTANKIGLEIDFTSGEDVQKLVEQLHKLPPSVIERTQRIIAKK